jgi:FMN phosphatase YigB (HAD superfamily)
MPAHKKVIFFDDSKVNVEAALECGWQAIRVDPFADPVGSMRACLDRLGLFARLGQGG